MGKRIVTTDARTKMSSLKIADMFDVRDKYVLVTGGGRGIGFMIAKGFAANGAIVFISSRKQQACEEAAAQIRQETNGGKIFALPGVDLSTLDGVNQCAGFVKDALMKHRGKFALDVLVNNSGVSWGAPLESFPEVGWDKVFNTNVKSIFFLTKALAPALEEAARHSTHASVINVGSVAGLGNQPYPTFSYDASKAAVHHLGRHLASALGHARITVNNLAPGLVPSKMSNQLKVYSSDDAMISGIPLGRKGEPQDMAGICILWASHAGAWTTGATVPVDGGGLVAGSGMIKKKAKL